jgi:hypothetical protein
LNETAATYLEQQGMSDEHRCSVARLPGHMMWNIDAIGASTEAAKSGPLMQVRFILNSAITANSLSLNPRFDIRSACCEEPP